MDLDAEIIWVSDLCGVLQAIQVPVLVHQISSGANIGIGGKNAIGATDVLPRSPYPGAGLGEGIILASNKQISEVGAPEKGIARVGRTNQAKGVASIRGLKNPRAV
jgi:hypothetical protein